MKVAKFGGTSLANAQQIQKVCSIVLSDPDRKIVVVSAPGKRFADDTKVTDLLIACAEQYWEIGEATAEWEAVIARYDEIAKELNLPMEIIEQIAFDLKERMLTKEQNTKERYMDLMKAAGEDYSARVVAHYLQSIGICAEYIHPGEAGMLVSDEPGNAQILPEAYTKLSALREREGILVFPGFFGFTADGQLVTFSRGGSDITGSILAAAIQADLYENFTDVDSVYSVNPKLVSHPHEIHEITFREMRELSYAGFSVFHEEALVPAFRAGIPVCIKNTNNPQAPGTRIVSERKNNSSNIVSGIAGDAGFCSIYLSKYLMNREIGFGRKVLQILEDEGLSYEHCPSGIDNISVILREDQLNPALESKLMQRIQDELDVDEVTIVHNLALVMIVGEGMRNSVGMAARATAALAKKKINIEMINQGSSEVSIMFGVKAKDVDDAVVALYHEFF